MVGVDVRSVWALGQTEFRFWCSAACLVGNFWIARKVARLPLGRSIVADIAASGLSVIFVGVIPIPLFAYGLAWWLLFGDRALPFSWIVPVLLSGMTGAGVGRVVLAGFKVKVTASMFWRLVSFNLLFVGIAVWRMVVYISAHPPEA